ncbi:MAG: type II secretion system F family protein [Patescibacteria group bacterium]
MNKPRIPLFNIFGRIKDEERINFARHLSIVIQAGLPLIEGLRIIRKQAASRNLGRMIDQIVVDVNSGQFLAASLERFPGVFDTFFVNIVQVGEVSGTLASNLLYLSTELKKSKDLKSKVRSALVYPFVVLVAMVAVVGFLVFFVFPKVLPIFQNFNVQLPATTRILIFISEFILNYWYYLLGGLIVFIIAARLFLRIDRIRYYWHWSLLHVPVLSRVMIENNVANMSRILAVLLKSGIKIVEAVKITAATFNNHVYREGLLLAAEEIRKGERIVHYLGEHRRIFPPLLTGLIEIGESTGNLESNLEYLSNYYSEEVETSLRNLTTLLEPILLLTLGLVVGFVAISIITPIYQITQGVNK